MTHPINIIRTQMCYLLFSIMQAITGCIHGTSEEKIYNELGIESLYNRRTLNRLLCLYKIKNNLLPEYPNNDIPHLPNLHNTRHHRSTWIPTRTNKYKNSFFPHSVNAWNNLSNLIKASPSINIFKKRYTDFFRVKKPSWYQTIDQIKSRS